MNERFIYSFRVAPRKDAEDRIRQLLDAAIRVFGSRGFRRARIDEIAAAAGVSPGNVYRYVTGKDALFRLVMESTIEGDAWSPPSPPFPVDGPPAAETIRWVGERLDFSDFAVMQAALHGRRRQPPAEELRAVIEELFAVIHRTRHAARILERSAPDMPELAAMFFAVRRELFDRMTRYVERRVRGGDFLALAAPAATARLLIEATVWAANERLDDPDPTTVIADDDALAALVELAERTLIGPSP